MNSLPHLALLENLQILKHQQNQLVKAYPLEKFIYAFSI